MLLGIIFVSVAVLGFVFLVGWRIYANRHFDAVQLCEGIASSEPFFREMEKTIVCFAKNKCVQIKQTNKPAFVEKIICRGKDLSNKFSHYINGRHFVEKNGCSGYWEEVNGYKKDNGGEQDNDKMPG
jgi:hypothetical protein